MSEDAKKSQRWKLILTIITLIALGLVIYFAWDNIVDTLTNLANINFYLLILYIPLQALNYHGYARLYQTLLSIFKEQVSYKEMYKTALEINFVNNVFPSGGVSGFSYFSIRTKRLDVPTSKATLTQLFRFVMVFISFQVFLVLGLIMLAIGGQASNLMVLIVSSITTAIIIGTALLAYIIGSKQRIGTFVTALTKIINKLIHIFRRKHPETISVDRVRRVLEELHENYGIVKNNLGLLKKPLMFALLANLTEIVTLYLTYVAFGYWVNPGAIIIAYAIANFAGLLSVLPGGVGIYEALMTGTLAAAGIPASLSLPVTLTYRVLSMLLQLPFGAYFYHKQIQGKNG